MRTCIVFVAIGLDRSVVIDGGDCWGVELEGAGATPSLRRHAKPRITEPVTKHRRITNATFVPCEAGVECELVHFFVVKIGIPGSATHRRA